MNITQVLGITGTIIAAVAYVPQIKHLIKEKCSAGISLMMYSLWVVSSLLMLINAISIHSEIFIIFQTCNIIAVVTILILGKIYEGDRCPYHKNNK
jgi:uncharacterized protein with PQ loop repeat